MVRKILLMIAIISAMMGVGWGIAGIFEKEILTVRLQKTSLSIKCGMVKVFAPVDSNGQLYMYNEKVELGSVKKPRYSQIMLVVDSRCPWSKLADIISAFQKAGCDRIHFAFNFNQESFGYKLNRRLEQLTGFSFDREEEFSMDELPIDVEDDIAAESIVEPFSFVGVPLTIFEDEYLEDYYCDYMSLNIKDTGLAPMHLKTKGSGEELLFNDRQMSIDQLEEILDEQIGFHNLRSVSLIVNEELTFINFLRIVNIFDEADGYSLNFLAD